MKQRKYTNNGATFYEVTFISSENENFRNERPTTHTAIVFKSGYWHIVIMIDGQMANSLAYADPKTAARNSWIVK